MNAAALIGQAARHAGREALAEALQASRADTLRSFAAWQAADPSLQVPQAPGFNLPLWELGHIGWFQEYWLARNPLRPQGPRADPHAPRLPPLRPHANALYDSSAVAHAARWQLALPDADATQADLARQLSRHLRLLADENLTDASDDGLYFYRLALFHEDMHHEATLYMAQALGLDLGEVARPAPSDPHAARAVLTLKAAQVDLGWRGPGFCFDNEVGEQQVTLPPTEIDTTVVRWADYLPFVEAGGYADTRGWTSEGLRWRTAAAVHGPRYLRQTPSADWQVWRQGRWQALDLQEPACHLSAHEAEAWCAWAGRRLPTEAQWQHAALTEPAAFHWGAVWEWTASAFEPWRGFTPHPYRDYSAPWFGSRRVLRGASFGTSARMHHPRYRNFFPPDRTDIFAGFRSCSM
jgi:gamma-glutamyl hercynylcysteine S-oxide synthase